MNAARVAGAASSLLVHAALVLAFLWPPGEVNGFVAAKPQPAEKNDEIDMRLIPSPEGTGVGLACGDSYTGIGIVTRWGGNVEEIVPGGPADRAGMHIGDVWLNGEMFGRDFYSIGRDLVLKIDRHGVRMDLPVRIDRICFEKGKS